MWITGDLGQDVYNNLFVQNDTPSGYPERYGRVQVTALFEYGGGYGQMNAYSYQLTVTGAELIPWSPASL